MFISKREMIIGILMFAIGVILALLINPYKTSDSKDVSEAELESYFRNHSVDGNRAAAIKINFTVPQSGIAYLGTIHGYQNNMDVCEELIASYNLDESLTVIPGSTYFCEILR